MTTRDLWSGFVTESNRIEGIYRAPTAAEIDATIAFVVLTDVGRDELTALVGVFQPDAVLRDQPGRNVIVGNHRPPLGGPDIPPALDEVLDMARTATHPYVTHHAYETLHPYTDGNGRSGRALWLWGMRRHYRFQRKFDGMLRIGFLHCWYYQSLEFGRVT